MKIIGVIVGGVAILVALLLGLALGIGYYLAPQSTLAHADAVVAISGGETSARAEEAIQLYKQGYASTIIFSGAAADTRGPSNAKVMERQAIAEGIDASHIKIDETSSNTNQNAAAVATIVHTQGIHSLILVTSPYHQRRASITFSHALPGVTIINHSAYDQNWSRSRWWTHSYNYGITLAELQKTVFLVMTGEK